jgi:phosphoenolpyruvate carboxylase
MSLTTARRDFAADEALLTDVLREVIAMGDGVGGGVGGVRVLRLLDDAVALGQEARLGDEGAADRLAELVAGLTLDETEVLVRALTRWFQLVNLAEDNERVRRLRARDAADPERPRTGSLRHVVSALREAGATAV